MLLLLLLWRLLLLILTLNLRFVYTKQLNIYCFLGLSVFLVNVVHYNERHMYCVVILGSKQEFFSNVALLKVIKMCKYLLVVWQDDKTITLSFIVELYLTDYSLLELLNLGCNCSWRLISGLTRLLLLWLRLLLCVCSGDFDMTIVTQLGRVGHCWSVQVNLLHCLVLLVLLIISRNNSCLNLNLILLHRLCHNWLHKLLWLLLLYYDWRGIVNENIRVLLHHLGINNGLSLWEEMSSVWNILLHLLWWNLQWCHHILSWELWHLRLKLCFHVRRNCWWYLSSHTILHVEFLRNILFFHGEWRHAVILFRMCLDLHIHVLQLKLVRSILMLISNKAAMLT